MISYLSQWLSVLETNGGLLHLSSHSGTGMHSIKYMVQPQPNSEETQAEILDRMSLGAVPDIKLTHQILLHEWMGFKIKKENFVTKNLPLFQSRET